MVNMKKTILFVLIALSLNAIASKKFSYEKETYFKNYESLDDMRETLMSNKLKLSQKEIARIALKYGIPITE